MEQSAALQLPVDYVQSVANLTDFLNNSESPQSALAKTVAFLAESFRGLELAAGCVFTDVHSCSVRALQGPRAEKAQQMVDRLSREKEALLALFPPAIAAVSSRDLSTLEALRQLCGLPDLSAALVRIVPGRNRTWGMLVACVAARDAFSPLETGIFRAASNVLANITQRYGADNDRRAEIRQALRAKREWEVTVDSLSTVICLLDQRGRILRANRAIEKWGLGTVADATGHDVAQLLSPLFAGTDCGLPDTYHAFWQGTQESVEWEQECPITRHFAHFVLRRLDVAGAVVSDHDESYAVIVIADITEQRTAQRTLMNYNRELEAKVRERTNRLIAANEQLNREVQEHKRDKAALMESKLELHELSSQLIGAQERERKRIAVELHDSVGQTLSAIKFSVEGLLPRLPVGEERRALEAVVRRIRDAVAEVRRVSMDLRPSILDDFGLLAALRWFFREYQAIYTGMALAFTLEVDEQDIPHSLRTNVFRIVQEALNNVAKHAMATRVRVDLTRTDERIVLTIGDDGIGFEPSALHMATRQTGFGLRSMRERAELTGGRFAIHARPGQGVVLEVSWPRGSRAVAKAGSAQG